MNGGPIGPRKPTVITGAVTIPLDTGLADDALLQLLRDAIDRVDDALITNAQQSLTDGAGPIRYVLRVEAICQYVDVGTEPA